MRRREVRPTDPVELPPAVLCALGVLTLACGVGWLLFLLWLVFLWEGERGRWLAAPLLLLAVPCFSYGRQWLFEGLGREATGVGAKWRAAAGGTFFIAAGVAMLVVPFSASDDGASPAAHLAVTLLVIQGGLMQVIIGGAIITRSKVPDLVARWLNWSIGLTMVGAIAALWSEGRLTQGHSAAAPVLSIAVSLVALAVGLLVLRNRGR